MKDYKSEKYMANYYKKTNTIGIKRKFAPYNQRFSFGGKQCGTEVSLRGLGDDAMKKLDDGQSENSVEEWAKTAARTAVQP